MKKIFLLLALGLGIAAPQQAKADWSNISIVLDPGHGGDDPGACYNSSSADGYSEASLVLRCAKAVYNELSSKGAYIHMTRWEDDFYGEIDLSPRRAYCYTYDSDVFVSFHLNAANASAHGTETWYYYDGSYDLAECVQSALINRFSSVDGEGGFDCIDRGIKNNGWTVITAGEYYPSVLTEGLFVDCYTDWQLIREESSVGFNAWVDGHLKGIYDYCCSRGWSVTEPTYGNASTGGGSTPTTSPYIAVSSNKVHINSVVGQTASTKVTLEGNKIPHYTTVRLTKEAKEAGFGVTSNDKAGWNLDDTEFILSCTTDGVFDPESPVIEITYTPTAVGSVGGQEGDAYYITLESQDAEETPVYQWIRLSGTATAPLMSLEEGWVRSDENGTLDNGKWDAGKVRNMDLYDGKLYMVYDHSVIKVVDARSGAYLYDLSTEGVEDGTLTLCDVRAFQGKIVACNLGGVDADGNWSPLKIYTWDPENPSAAPVLIANINVQGLGINRLGDYIEVGGDWINYGRFLFGYAKRDDQSTIVYEFDINKGVVDTTPKTYRVTTDGTNNLASGASVRVVPQTYGYMFDSKDSQPTKLDGNFKRIDYMANYNRWGNACRVFEYQGNEYALISSYSEMTYNGPADANGNPTQTAEDIAHNYTGGNMTLVTWDLNNGSSFNAPLTLGRYPEKGLSSKVRNLNCTGNVLINQSDDDYFEAWILSTGQGIAYYKTGAAPEPTTPENPDPEDPDPEGPTPIDPEIGNFTEIWQYSVAKNNLPAWFDKSTQYTRTAAIVGDKVVVANIKAWASEPDALTLTAISADGSATTSAVNKTGITGGLVQVGSLANYNGKLVASNAASVASSFKVYMWKNGLDQAPELILEDANHGKVPAGENMYISNGRIGIAGYDNTDFKVIWYQIYPDGTADATPHVIIPNTNCKGNRGATSVYFEEDGSFWLNNKDMHPTHFSADGQTILHEIGTDDKVFGTGGDIFTYGTNRYYVTTHSLGGSTVYDNVSTRILDITDPDNVVDKGTYPTEGLGAGKWSDVGSTDVKADVVESRTNYKRVRFVTVAPMQGITLYQLEVRSTGVNDIAVDDENNDVEVVYYNLQGVRMNSDNMAPDLYIRRVGEQATKVLVK